MEGENLGGFTTDPNNPDVMVSLFEDSIENHFRAMDTISKLCGEKEEEEASYASDERFSSTITFLREWKNYCYRPRTVRFTCEVEDPQGKDVLNALILPQFSAASVPKLESLSSEQNYLKASKDSVMYVGGPVWALDWCPSVHQRSDSPIKCEYLAVAAHPPESSYHKIGVPLTGRGIVQIWCLLNANFKEEDLPPLKKPEKRGRPRKNTVVEEKGDLDKGRDGISPPPKKAKGRPRKKVEESIGDLDRNIQFDQALVHLDKEKISLPLKKARGRPRKKTVIEEHIADLDDDDLSVKAHSVQLDKGIEKNSLPLEKARGALRKKTVTEECTGDSDKNDQLAQVPPVQLDKGLELPLESTRGRHGKKSVIEEPIGDLDGNGQFIQALAFPLFDKTVKESSPPLKKARGRPRKRKGVKGTLHDLDIGGGTISALAVEFPEGQAGISSSGQLKIYHEQEVLNIPDTDVEFERQIQQGFSDTKVACISGHNILRLERKVEDKAKAVICHEMRKNPDTDVEFGRETHQDFAGTELACKSGHNIPRPKRKAKDRARALIELLNSHDDGEVERQKQLSLNSTEVADKSGKHIPRPKRKMKSKPRAEIYHDDIHPHFLSKHVEKESPIAVVQAAKNCDQDPMPSCQTALSGGSLDTNTPNFHLPKEVALPRVVLCLAHNGKVAWDVKWRPSNMDGKHCMGYLAVLLGNGSLEVWEVPFPGTIKVLYSSYKRENTDPRFVKLAPVFRCSKLKCGDRQSIPLTLEWSPSAPHDLILAGCHDGTVALWKFSPSGSSQDTRPLLYFTADTVPIRALAWAPDGSDSESANIIVTAGHGGVRFWDLRDPYHPLWELNPGRRGVYSLDWLPDPRCIIMSFDDGTLRFLCMSNSANDVPVTGKPFDGTQQQGLHSYVCSSFPIWSIQASKLTGLVAYSTADGSVLRFQLTSKAVDKDPSRNRTPHFLCASLTAEDDSTVEINTPLPNIPYPLKKPLNEVGDTTRSMRRFLSASNQAKRVTNQTSDEPNLALCYGDDPTLSGSGNTTPLATPKTKSTSKPKVPQKKTSTTLDMVCSYGEEAENLQREENHKDEKGNEIEALPSKLVAMHRVRWNTNKGSERWLCYGGAAGIVRCQEFSAQTIKECALMKR